LKKSLAECGPLGSLSEGRKVLPHSMERQRTPEIQHRTAPEDGYRSKRSARVYDSLFRNQLGKSADRSNPADEGGRRTARVVATSCVLGVKHSSLSARLREQQNQKSSNQFFDSWKENHIPLSVLWRNRILCKHFWTILIY